MAKIIVGMSGGVDSSVTAYILKERGFDVEGVSFLIWEARERCNRDACCSLEAARSASETARQIGIPHMDLDVRKEFIDAVIEPFVSAYATGITPNPCILCNRLIKFPLLLKEAKKSGADYISTGHYARVGGCGSGGTNGTRHLLKKGVDLKKDQSYVLYGLRPEELERLILPLGDLTKKEVREIARSLGLPAAERPESQEICFIGAEGYADFIRDLSPSLSQPGEIVDREGNVLGSHGGIFRYTIGQRKGLGISSPDPYYVTAIDPGDNRIRVGRRSEALASSVVVSELNWLAAPPSQAFKAGVKFRSMMADVPADVELHRDNAIVRFLDPQWAPAPGQSAVWYLNDAVLGGGIIRQTV